MSMSRDILFLALALARLCVGVEEQSDGVCNLGDETCPPSPKALIQMNSRVSRNLALLDSAASEGSLAISTAGEVGNGTIKQPALNDVEYQALATKCCWRDMEEFVVRVAKEVLGFEFCERGGLLGLLGWFDCTDDHQNYDTLVEAIRGLGPDANGAYKDNCPVLAKSCVDFPRDGNCPVIIEPMPECGVTTTTTTSNCLEANWDAEVFDKCDFWGDPHWHATFFDRKGKMNFYGNGIFEVASSKDGSFRAQSFQCKVVPKKEKPNMKQKPAVAVALAMDIDGRKIFIQDHDVQIDGVPAPPIGPDGYIDISQTQCVRFKVRAKDRSKKGNPGWAQALELRIHRDTAKAAGLCGQQDPNHQSVPQNEILFTEAQIAQICTTCTVDPPAICSKSYEQVSEKVAKVKVTAKDLAAACSDANPPIKLEDAQKICAGAIDMNMCVLDYCATDGDPAMAEAAVEEANIFVPGCKRPAEACSTKDDCCDDMICDLSVCKWPKASPCAQPKFGGDSCLPGRDYATNSSISETRCQDHFWLPDMSVKGDFNGFHEVDSLDECADLCDNRKGCVGFDFKNKEMSSRAKDGTKKWRCSLCGSVGEECPKLKAKGQYTHYHRTSSGCPVR